MRLGWAIAAVLVVAGCKPPHAAVELRDPDGLAANAVELVVAGADAQTVFAQQHEGGFPVSLTLTANDEGERGLWFEARDNTGKPLARVYDVLMFSRADGSRVALSLQSACETDAECNDGLFCNGQERCDDRICQAGAMPCLNDDNSCVTFSCDEDADTCPSDLDHESCAGLFENDETGEPLPGYCDVALGCQVGVACEENADCDDGLGCTGADICVGGRCFIDAFVVEPDENGCTFDVCSEPGITVHPHADGQACDLVATNDGICESGVCVAFVPTAPDAPVFSIRGPQTGSTTLTLSQTVDVVVSTDAIQYLIEEGETPAPAIDDPRWADYPAPTTFTLSAGDGLKTVTLWVKNQWDLINSVPARRSITLSADVIPVGPTASSCPSETLGLCAFHNESGAFPIQLAVDAASAGAVIWLYPGTYTMADDSPLVIDKSLTIEAVAGTSPHDVRVVTDGYPGGGQPVINLAADNITLRGFYTHTTQRNPFGIEATPIVQDGPRTTGHLLDRLFVECRSNGGVDWNYFNGAIRLAGDSTIQNSAIVGTCETAVRMYGPEGGAATGNRLVHNTIVSDNHHAPLRMEYVDGAVVENNLFITTRPDPPLPPAYTAIECNGGCVNVLIDANAYSGYATETTADLTSLVGHPLPDDGLASLWDLRPALGSVLINLANPVENPGALDLYGRPRVDGGQADIGAVEAQAIELVTRLPSTIAVGVADNACNGGACDFVGGTEQLSVLHAVFRHMRPGDTVQLHDNGGALARYYTSNARITRKITLETAPTSDRSQVELDVANGQRLFTVEVADGVVMRDLNVDCYNCSFVEAEWSSETQDSRVRFRAEDLVVERISLTSRISAGQWGVAGFVLAGGGTLKNSLAHGSWAQVVAARGDGNQIINNTFVNRCSDNGPNGLSLNDATNTLVANNLLAFVDNGVGSRSAVSGDDGTAATSFENNQFYGVSNLGDAYVTVPTVADGGTSCVGWLEALDPSGFCSSTDPNLMDMDGGDAHLTMSSPALDFGASSHAAPGDVDLDGNPRQSGSSVDVGCYELQQ